MRTFASVLILAGSAFALLAGWGQVRMHDLFVRMHVATKPPTLGLALVLTGARDYFHARGHAAQMRGPVAGEGNPGRDG